MLRGRPTSARFSKPRIGFLNTDTGWNRTNGSCFWFRTQPDHGGRNVAALRFLSRLQSDRRVIAEFSQSCHRCKWAAAGNVSRKRSSSGLVPILRNFAIRPNRLTSVISSSGCNLGSRQKWARASGKLWSEGGYDSLFVAYPEARQGPSSWAKKLQILPISFSTMACSGR